MDCIPFIMNACGATASDGGPGGAIGRVDQIPVGQRSDLVPTGKKRRVRAGGIENTRITVDICQPCVAVGDSKTGQGTFVIAFGLPTVGRHIKSQLTFRTPPFGHTAAGRCLRRASR